LACVSGLFATAYAPGNWIEWHARLGYALLTLLLFRLVWGWVGGYWSRFASFVPRSGGPLPLGHSPQGALAVVVILLTLVAQVATGLVGDDEIAFTGPLNRWVSTDLGLAATAWHKGVGQWLLVGLIALHVLAITFYAVVRRNNLVGPMVRGDTQLPIGADLTQTVVASLDTRASRVRALWVLALCAGAVYGLIRFS
jgi:cytochrome b